jgi:hypothetical protein
MSALTAALDHHLATLRVYWCSHRTFPAISELTTVLGMTSTNGIEAKPLALESLYFLRECLLLTLAVLKLSMPASALGDGPRHRRLRSQQPGVVTVFTVFRHVPILLGGPGCCLTHQLDNADRRKKASLVRGFFTAYAKT